MAERNEKVFEHIASTLVQFCFLSYENVRCYSTQYCIFLIKYCLLLHANKANTIELCVLLFNKLSQISHPDCKQFIFYSIYGFITDYKENIGNSWEILISSCCCMLITIESPNLTEVELFSIKEYMSRRLLSIIQLIVDQCLKFISINGIIGLINFMDKFASFTDNVNFSLVVTGYLITISDFVCGKFLNDSVESSDSPINNFWSKFFTTLCSISSDSRPTLRKSAVQTLFNIIEVRRVCLSKIILNELLENELCPLIEKTASMVREPSSDEIESSEQNRKLKNSISRDLLQVHHSRNTPQKQWMETLSLLITGVSKLYLQYIQNIHKKKKCELDSAWKTFCDFLMNSFTHSNIELSYNAVYCLSIMLPPCQEYTNKNKSKLNKPCHIWNIALTAVRKFYDFVNSGKLIMDTQTLDRVKEQFTLISQICSIAFPYIIEEISEKDIDTWIEFFNILIKIEITKSSTFNSTSSQAPKSTYQEKSKTQQRLFISFIRCKCSVIKHSSNSSLVMYFMAKLLSFIKDIMAKPTEEDIYFEILLHEITIFYNENISKYSNFVEYYKDFIMLWEGPLTAKYSYSSPFAWRKCLWSFYTVTKPSLLPYFSIPLESTHIIHMIDILKLFLFSDFVAPPNISSNDLQQDNDKDSELIVYLSTVFIPGLSNSCQDILNDIVDLMLKGFASVSTISPNKKKYDNQKNVNLRQEFNDACTDSLINLSLGSIGNDSIYSPPVFHTAKLALETLSNRCASLIDHVSKIDEDSQDTQLIIEAASSLKASRAVFSRAGVIFSSQQYCSRLDTPFLDFLHIQLLSLYDTCVFSITLKKSSLRILAQEALQEFRTIILKKMAT